RSSPMGLRMLPIPPMAMVAPSSMRMSSSDRHSPSTRVTYPSRQPTAAFNQPFGRLTRRAARTPSAHGGSTGGRCMGDGVALVTGGSGAIGAAVCRRLAADGFDVALTYGRNRDGAEATAAAVRELGRRATVLGVDVGDAAAVADVVEQVLERHGRLTTVVTAAAPVASQRFLSRIDAAAFAEQLRADAVGLFHVAAAALPALRDSRGCIVAVTTVA